MTEIATNCWSESDQEAIREQMREFGEGRPVPSKEAAREYLITALAYAYEVRKGVVADALHFAMLDCPSYSLQDVVARLEDLEGSARSEYTGVLSID